MVKTAAVFRQETLYLNAVSAIKERGSHMEEVLGNGSHMAPASTLAAFDVQGRVFGKCVRTGINSVRLELYAPN